MKVRLNENESLQMWFTSTTFHTVYVTVLQLNNLIEQLYGERLIRKP